MGRSVLVTGGAGFIGSHLVEALVGKGDDVKVIDNLSVTDQNLPLLKSLGVEVMVGDVSDFKDVMMAVKGMDSVCHLAAMNRAMRSVDDPLEANLCNVTGTVNVLEAAKQAELDRVVFSSSSSIYGSSHIFPRKEDQRPAPTHPYGVSKLAGELYCKVYKDVFSLDTVVLRYFSCYGPRQRGDIKYSAVIPKFIEAMLSGRAITVFGDGSQRRNFTFVKDNVGATMAALEKPGAVGEVINVAGVEEVSINDLVSDLEEILDQKAEREEGPLPVGDLPQNPPDLTKAKELLEYTPKYTFREGLEEMVEHYRKMVG